MKGLRLRWPTLSARFTADVLAGHSAVALTFSALIYLVCLTGAVCVFMDELQLWETPSPAPVAFDPASSEALVSAAIARAGGAAKAELVFLRAPVNPHERTVVSIGERRWAPGADGRLVPLTLPWTGFLEALHINLTLPARLGEFIVGLLGMALFSLLISGVLAHPRILRDAFVLRLGGSRRLQEADLHNRMGVWGLPFHLAVTLSGALFGLAALVFAAPGALGHRGDVARIEQVFTGPRLAADARPAPLPPLGRIVRDAQAFQTGSKLYYFSVAAPGTRGAQVRVEATAPGRLPRGEAFYYDQAGRRIGRTRFATGDLGLQLYSGAAQVHFGAFGGLPVRLAYGVLGWALCWVCAGGTTIWLARRRDRGRPAPRLERAWSALVWGVPIALAAATLAPWPTMAFWLALSSAVVFGLAPPRAFANPQTIDRVFRLMLSLTLAATAILHLQRSLHDSAALCVEAALALTSLLLGLTHVYSSVRVKDAAARHDR